MAARWWRYSATFMGAGEDYADALARLRALFDGMPLKGLHLSVSPMSERSALRILDREVAKAMIEVDADEGIHLIHPPGYPTHPYQQGLWIFPDDHPLAPYERLAKEQGDDAALDRMRELEAGE